MKTRSRKSKGKALQNLVAKKVQELLAPFGVDPQDVKSTTMGESGVDIQLSASARDHLPVSIECKSHARMAIYSLFQQAEETAKSGETPVLVVKANRKSPLAVVPLDYWIKLEEDRIVRGRT